MRSGEERLSAGHTVELMSPQVPGTPESLQVHRSYSDRLSA